MNLIPYYRKLHVSLKHSFKYICSGENNKELNQENPIWTNKQTQCRGILTQMCCFVWLASLQSSNASWKWARIGPKWAEKVTLCHHLHIGPEQQINSLCLRQLKYRPGKEIHYRRWWRRNNITKSSSKCPGAWIDFQVLHDVQWHLHGRQRSHCLTSLV